MPKRKHRTRRTESNIKLPITPNIDEGSDTQCSVCFEKLSGTNSDQFPVNLSCGHSNLCITCARRLVHDSDSIRCPQCSQITESFDATNIPINITVKSMLEYREAKANALSSDAASLSAFQALSASLNEIQLSSHQLCQNPEDDEECENKALLYCRNCDLSFCQVCGEKTHKMKILKSHILQPFASRTPMCPLHPLSLLNKVCLTDQVLICAECQVEDHNDNHHVRKVEEVSKNVRNIIATRMQGLDFMESVLKMNETDANQHHQDIVKSAERSMLEVDTVIDKVIQQCKSHRVELKQEIETFMKAQLNQCEETLSQVSQSQSRIATVRESIEKDISNDFDLLKSTQDIDRQLDELEKQLREFLDNKPSLATFEVQFDESPMEETVSRLCSLQQSEVASDNERKLTVLQEVQKLADNHTIDEQNKLGNTKLMRAAYGGDDIKVETLIKFGAIIDLFNKDGDTALYRAAYKGHDKCLKLLLEAGAQKDIQNFKHGNTALIVAAREGHDKCLKLLLEAGAQNDTQNNHGDTALTIAGKRGHEKCFELVFEAGAHKTTGNRSLDNALKLKLMEIKKKKRKWRYSE